ncbi:hypothetical protein EJ07DRAFT_154561 [Lizonia empirigonia]|nr:hypothetical protein EJ07DRAFT_154561 [Lizonia empirigonia]
MHSTSLTQRPLLPLFLFTLTDIAAFGYSSAISLCVFFSQCKELSLGSPEGPEGQTCHLPSSRPQSAWYVIFASYGKRAFAFTDLLCSMGKLRMDCRFWKLKVRLYCCCSCTFQPYPGTIYEPIIISDSYGLTELTGQSKPRFWRAYLESPAPEFVLRIRYIGRSAMSERVICSYHSYQNHGQTRPDHSTHHGPGQFRKAIKYQVWFEDTMQDASCTDTGTFLYLDEVIVDMRNCQSCPPAINDFTVFKSEFRSYSRWA